MINIFIEEFMENHKVMILNFKEIKVKKLVNMINV